MYGLTDDENKIKELWDDYAVKKEVKLESVVTIYYDAWMNDNDVEPILSLIYEIMKQVGMSYPETNDVDKKEILQNLGADIVRHFTGADIKKYFDSCEKKNQFEKIKDDKDLFEQIREFFNTVLVERGNRLVFFIDELDRCKPDYAVRLLERIKHYFNNEKVTFVFAINLSELQHTIKSYYGQGFNATRYLDRFFDFRLVDMEDYNSIISGIGEHILVDIIDEGVGKVHSTYMLNSDEVFTQVAGGMKPVKMADKLREIYYAVFVEKFNNIYEKDIGQMSFTKKSRERLFEVISLFSNLTDFNDE